MRMFCVIAAASVLLLSGTGCDWNRDLGWNLPPTIDRALPTSDPAAAAEALDLEAGMRIAVRPAAFAVGDTAGALGFDARAMDVEVLEAKRDGALRLSWTSESATGSLALHSWSDVHAMLLPAFWPEGDTEATGDGGLWLSSTAYADLVAGRKAEWLLARPGRASAALEAAFDAAARASAFLSGSASGTPASAIEKTALVEAYPLAVDGRITLVRAVKASGRLFDLVVLANPEHPLVLSVTPRAAALPALQALGSAGGRWPEPGYGVTSIRRP